MSIGKVAVADGPKDTSGIIEAVHGARQAGSVGIVEAHCFEERRLSQGGTDDGGGGAIRAGAQRHKEADEDRVLLDMATDFEICCARLKNNHG